MKSHCADGFPSTILYYLDIMDTTVQEKEEYSMDTRPHFTDNDCICSI